MDASNKSIYNHIKKEITEDKKFVLNIFKRNVGRLYMRWWTKNEDVRLITLDGSYGGRSGKKYDYLSTDLSAADDWHLGKFYDEQGNFRWSIVIEDDENGKPKIRHSNAEELHNAYLIVPKRMLRMKSKNLMRAKTDELLTISFEMVEKYIKEFNDISNGEVYKFSFGKLCPNGFYEKCEVSDVYGDVFGNEKVYHNVLSNLTFTDKEYISLTYNALGL